MSVVRWLYNVRRHSLRRKSTYLPIVPSRYPTLSAVAAAAAVKLFCGRVAPEAVRCCSEVKFVGYEYFGSSIRKRKSKARAHVR